MRKNSIASVLDEIEYTEEDHSIIGNYVKSKYFKWLILKEVVCI